jgi:hypothetical protein
LRDYAFDAREAARYTLGVADTMRRLGSILWKILGVAGDLHFGWSMLFQYILPSGAGAVLLTAFLDYVTGFGDYLAELPWLFRWAVYVSVFILIFVALNHLITLGSKAYHRSRARRRYWAYPG